MESGEPDEIPESTIIQHVDAADTGLREWVLVEGNRLIIAVGFVVAVLLVLLGASRAEIIGFQDGGAITRISGGMVAGTFSLVTITVAINQLILSQELATAGELRERLNNILDLRTDIESAIGIPTSPAEPVRLLDFLVASIRDRADDLSDAVSGESDDVRRPIALYVRAVVETTDRVDTALSNTESGTLKAVSTVLKSDTDWQIYAARRLRNRYADSLSEDTIAVFDDLLEVLELFDVMRLHLRGIYIQRELAKLSQLMVVFGVPAVLAAVFSGLLYGNSGGAVIPPPALAVATSLLIAVVVSPLALLAAYVLRIATIARRSTVIGPLLPERDPTEDLFERFSDDESSDQYR